MFFRGGNCVRMDIGKFLSNKMITVTDTCAAWVRFVGVIQSVFGDFLSVVQFVFSVPILVVSRECKASP